MMLSIRRSDMDSSLLKVFLTVAEEGTVSGAAKTLNCVQSNVTARLKQLEESAGRRLFYRRPRGVTLTDAGEVLLPHAREIVKKIEDAEMVMKNLGEEAGRLRIGSTESNAAVRLTPLLVKLHSAYPKIEFQLFTGTTDWVTEQLLNYKLDIAFVSGRPKNPELAVLREIEEQMVLVEPADGVVPDVVINFKRGCTYKEHLEKIMGEMGISGYRTMEFGSLDTILGCVSAGMGRTLLPLAVVEKLGEMSTLKVIKPAGDAGNIPTCMVCRKDAMPAIDIDIFDFAQ